MKKSDENTADNDTYKGFDSDLDDSVVSEENLRNAVKKIKEKLKKTEIEKAEYLTELQKAKADFVNLRKRDEKEKELFAKFTNEKLILEILPVLDGFGHATREGESWSSLSAEWKKGVQSIMNKLIAILAKEGLLSVGKVGEKFDPSVHEAIGTVKVNSKKDDHVVMEVLQIGYKLNDKVIRPAKVRVGEFTEN